MGRQITCGFESAMASTTAILNGETESGWSSNTVNNVGTVTYQNTTARVSGYAAQCGPSAANYVQFAAGNHTNGQPFYTRAYVRFNAAPSQQLQLFTWRINAVAAADIVMSTGRVVSLRDLATTTIATTSALAVDTWHMLESKIIVNTGTGVGTLELRLNGAVVGTSTSASTGTSVTTSTHRWGHHNAGETACTLYIDDVAFNDHLGTAQNTYPGDGHVTLLLPSSDNTKGTGWEAPQTTGSDTTNIYDAINNLPPAGVAHSDVDANNLKYIFNAASLGAVSDYRANCLTPAFYAPLGSNMAVSQAIGRLSSSATTGTNNMELQGITPADTAVTCAAAASTAAGTEPTGWKSFRTAPSYNALTISTGPVVEATKSTLAQANAHMVDLLGLMIEWNPPLTFADSAALTDAVSIKLTKAASDSAALTDSATPVLTPSGTAHTQSPSDSAALTDAVTKVLTKASADSAALTDAAAKAVSIPRADAAALTDAAARTATKPVADSAALTDASTRKPGKGIADSAALTDARTKAITHPVADSAALTDASARTTTKPLSDSAALTDAQAKAVGKSVADSANLTDEEEILGGGRLSFGDGASLTDSITARVGKTASDNAAVTDGRSATVGKARADNFAVTDQAKLRSTKAISDSVAITDSVTIQLARKLTISDQVAATDQAARAAEFSRSFSDSYAATDTATRSSGYERVFADLLTISDDVDVEGQAFEAFATIEAISGGTVAATGTLATVSAESPKTDLEETTPSCTTSAIS